MNPKELDQHLRKLERALRARTARIWAIKREKEAVEELKARYPTKRLPFLK